MARFYGIDPSRLSRHEQQIWNANIQHIWAEELLRERGGSLSGDELYQVLLLVEGDPQKAAIERARRLLRDS